jgi:ankyrin repeat protein
MIATKSIHITLNITQIMAVEHIGGFTRIVKYGDIDQIRKFINKNDVHNIDLEEMTPLHYAIKRNDPKIVQILIDYGADLNAKNKDGLTPLHYAVSLVNVNLDIVQLLIKGSDVNSKIPNVYSILHTACYHKGPILVETLIKAGADVNENNNQDGRYPLHVAVLYSDLDTIKCLLDNGADVNATNNDEETALHLAAENDRIEVVKILLLYGADKNLASNAVYYNELGHSFHGTPEEIARHRGYHEVADYIRDYHSTENIKEPEFD